MTNTRQLLFGGVLLAALVLAGPATAWAQPTGDFSAAPTAVQIANSHDTLLVSWMWTDGGLVTAASFEVGLIAHKTATAFGTGTPTVLPVPGGSAASQMVVGGLIANTRYIVSVRAVGGSPAARTVWGKQNSGLVAFGEGTTFTAASPAPIRTRDLDVTPGDMELTVEWDEPYAGAPGFDVVEYFVDWAEKSDGTGAKRWPYTITDRIVTIDRLKNGTMYYVAVGSKNDAGGRTDPSFTSGTRAMGTPTPDDTDDIELDAPIVTVGEPTHNSVMVSWMAVDGATAYSLNYRMDGGRNVNVYLDMDMEYPITGLMPDTMYSVSVCAHAEGADDSCSEDKFKTAEDAGGTTDPGTTGPGTTGTDGVAEGAPEKVVLRTATATSTTITISWEPPGSGMTRLVDYQLEYEAAGQGEFKNNIPPEQVNVQSWTITDLKPATSYRIRLKAQNRVQGAGEWSEWQEVTTMVAATSPPVEETVAGAPEKVVLRTSSAKSTTTTISIYWDVPGSGKSRLVDYQVRYGLAAGGDSGLLTNNVDVTAASPVSHVIEGLTAGTAYFYRVRAQNLEGYGPWSNDHTISTMATPGAPPAGPGISKMAEPMVEAGDMMLMVSWAEPASEKSITHYLVDYKTASAAQWMAKPMNVTAMEYTIDGLINSTVYLVRVRAVDSAGAMGEWSDSGSGTPMAMEEPEEPMPTPTPALPIFGALALGLGLVAAGRRRLRRRELRAGRVQQQITR